MPGYVFDFSGHGQFDPNGRANVPDVAAHNAAVAASELEAWAAKPDRWAVYVTKVGIGQPVTTWTGSPLGTIISATRFRTNISRNMVALTIRGTNGAIYHGRFGSDWSQLCRIRKARRQ